MQTPTDLISTKEASDILRESIKNVIRRVVAGELTPVKKFPGLRGAFVFDRADVIALNVSLHAPVEPVSPEATGSTGAVLCSGGAA